MIFKIHFKLGYSPDKDKKIIWNSVVLLKLFSEKEIKMLKAFLHTPRAVLFLELKPVKSLRVN